MAGADAAAVRERVAGLSADARALRAATVSKRTAATYMTGWRRWEGFCESVKRPRLGDVTQDAQIGETVALFVADMAGQVAPSTIGIYLSAVRHKHIVEGLHDPTERALNPAGRATLEGAAAVHGKPASKKMAMTMEMLRDITRSTRGTRDEAAGEAVLVATFAALRAGEVCPAQRTKFDVVRHLTRWDARRDQAGRFVIHIARSKCSNGATCVTVGMSRHGNILCPATAAARARARGPDMAESAPLFQRQDGKSIIKNDMARIIAEAAVRAGHVSSATSAHSCRITAFNLMLAAGFGKEAIREHGRWASNAAEEYKRDVGSARAYGAPTRPADVHDVAGTLLDLPALQ